MLSAPCCCASTPGALILCPQSLYKHLHHTEVALPESKALYSENRHLQTALCLSYCGWLLQGEPYSGRLLRKPGEMGSGSHRDLSYLNSGELSPKLQDKFSCPYAGTNLKYLNRNLLRRVALLKGMRRPPTLRSILPTCLQPSFCHVAEVLGSLIYRVSYLLFSGNPTLCRNVLGCGFGSNFPT